MIFSYIKDRWRNPNGYSDLLRLAIPLILSTASWSILHFVDRMFLTWYSNEAVAAAMPAGILNFALISIFVGTAGYAGTFIAQYFGAGEEKKIGMVLWHSVYISIAGSLFILLFIPLAPIIFNVIGHMDAIRDYETIYFQTLCFGGLGPILSAAFAGFYSGRGKNWPVMAVNFITTAINIGLDALFIFGWGPIPEMGVFGAAVATVIAGFSSVIIYLVMILRPKYQKLYKILSSFKPDGKFIGRYIRYGLPNGVHMFLDIVGFSLFLLIIGRIGTAELAATNIAFNINTLAFMPMLGSGMAVGILVGQNIGKGDKKGAEYAAVSGVQLTFTYMISFSLMYWILPEMFIFPFAVNAEKLAFFPIKVLAKDLLRFVGIFCFFDTMGIIFSSAVKGAGDTRFVMIISIIMSLGVLVIPSFFIVVVFHLSLYIAWAVCTGYVILLGVTFMLRYVFGPWRDMKVIEEEAPILPSQFPDDPLDPV